MLKQTMRILPLFFLCYACNVNQEVNLLQGAYMVSAPPQQAQKKTTKPDAGQAAYLKYCMACHQKDGSGVPGMYPPLQKSNWVTGDKKRLVSIVVNGLQGEIEVNGEIYSQTMPMQNYLTNKEIANVLSYLRKNFGNKADSVKVSEVTAIRKQLKK